MFVKFLLKVKVHRITILLAGMILIELLRNVSVHQSQSSGNAVSMRCKCSSIPKVQEMQYIFDLMASKSKPVE